MSSSHLNVTGLCLAAGFATRLRPVSDLMPKAAIPLMGVPSLYFALDRLERAGITRVAVNAHHHAEKVRELVNVYPSKTMDFEISMEREILGTGGALIPLKDFFGDNHVLLANPDIVTDLNINQFIETHLAYKAIMTIAVLGKTPSGKQATVHMQNQLVQEVAKTKTVSASHSSYGVGYFLVSPKLFRYLPVKPALMNLDVAINAAIKAGETVSVFEHNGYFRDFGDSFEDYFGVHKDLVSNDARLFKSLDIASVAHKFGKGLSLVKRKDATLVASEGLSAEKLRVTGHAFLFGKLEFQGDAQIANALLYSDKRRTILSGAAIKNRVILNQHEVILSGNM